MARDFLADGTHTYDYGEPTHLRVTGDITVCAWTKFSTNNSTNGPFICRWGSSSSWSLQISAGGGNEDKYLFVVRVSSASRFARTSSQYDDGLWHFVAGVFNGSNVFVLTFGADGVLEENVTGHSSGGPIDNPTGAPFTIGGYGTGASASGFPGSVFNAAMYAEAKTVFQLRLIAKYGPMASPSNIRLYAPLGFGGVDDAEPEFSGNALTGTSAGSPPLADNPAVAPWFGYDSVVPYAVAAAAVERRVILVS